MIDADGSDNVQITKKNGIKETMGLHNSSSQKIQQQLFSYWLPLLTCLVQTNFLLVA